MLTPFGARAKLSISLSFTFNGPAYRLSNGHAHSPRLRHSLMRPALQNFLACPSAVIVVRDLIHSGKYSICQKYFHGASDREHAKGKPRESPKLRDHSKRYGSRGVGVLSPSTIGQLAGDEAVSESFRQGVQAVARVQEQGVKTSVSKTDSPSRAPQRQPGWRQHLSTFTQYQKESDLDAARHDRPLLIEDERYAADWKLWLELIRFRRRHHGTKGTQALYREIFRRDMSMPTRGAVGKELWDASIMIAYHDSKFLPEITAYAIKIKRTTGEAWSRLYYSVVVCGLIKNPTLAYSLHIRLKEDFPPSLGDYQKLFHRSTAMDNVDAFERLYRDLPLPGMYGTIIPELCRLLNNRDAIRWHYLLFTCQDLPLDFNNIKPLLAYLAHLGDDRQIEQIVKDLKEVQGEITSIPLAAEKFVRERQPISREIFNRQLGKVHGVAPKHLSDSFCARLFATRLFSVETIISGLQMIAVETIGPLSIREIASRDNYHPSNFTRHLHRLKDAGILPDRSAFSLLIQKLASNDEQKLFRSVVECDLHPETFEDADVQERLLAEYYGRSDQLLIERTLAAITVRCKEQDLAKWRWNLTLRSHVKLRRIDAVKSILEAMKQQGIPVTTRSSRHLRVCWLSERRVGRAAHSTRELSIIINATQSTMLSGRHVPITAWREIMRRLGMAGRLPEFENLALWLVDHYTSPAGMTSLPSRILVNTDKASEHASNSNPQAFLKSLFTIAAQHAIVAWGFQQAVKCPPGNFRRVQTSFMVLNRQRPLWIWGLVLLRSLQQRGVPIHRSTVARICTQRLDILFGSGISRSHTNQRSRALDRHALGFYIRGMKKIWGGDLFRHTGTPELEAP